MRAALTGFLAVFGLASAPADREVPAGEPGVGWTAGPLALRPDTRARLLEEADRARSRPPGPVAQLSSAGATSLDDPLVTATRAAFEDADDAVILALAYRATGEAAYLDATRARLVAWARTHEPSGNPIDESRLDALVHAYTLIRGDLLVGHELGIRAWLARMREAQRAWRLGPRTARNNHRTHQLKMLLLLDRALGDEPAFAGDVAAAEAHAGENLDAATGESVDLRERDALYYHVYNLDAWLEIALASKCCLAPVEAAWSLLDRRLAAGEVDGEFEGSVVSLDVVRAHAGFAYAARFDPRRAEHARLAWHTLAGTSVAVDASRVQRRNLHALVRYESWTR
jgi:hypothetical protein